MLQDDAIKNLIKTKFFLCYSDCKTKRRLPLCSWSPSAPDHEPIPRCPTGLSREYKTINRRGMETLFWYRPHCFCEVCTLGVFTWQKQRGLYQSKATSNLATIQRPGLLPHNCKMAYCCITVFTSILTNVKQIFPFIHGLHSNQRNNVVK